MGVPRVYRQAQEQTIATFDFVDIVSRTGNVTFYGAAQSGALVGQGITAAEGRTFMSPIAVYSDAVFSRRLVSPASLAFIEAASFTFTSTFNVPANLKGDLLVNLGERVESSAGSDSMYTECVVSKNTTNLVTASGAIHTAPSASNLNSASLIKAVVPLTNFKKDDTLNILLRFYHKSTNPGTGTHTISVGHDPQGRDPSTLFGDSTSKLIFTIPFRPDL